MRFHKSIFVAAAVFWGLVCLSPVPASGGCKVEKDAAAVVKKAFDYYRGNASVSVAQMTIHRPDWERTMKIKAWTRGEHESLFRILAPPKDRGNGTLKKGSDIWMFNPKVNRVIKLPPSMMSQSWMGSDFSNNDLAKSDTIVTDYTHEVSGCSMADGLKVYEIKSLPLPAAPVVWGMLTFKIREDGIILAETFYDEEKTPVKRLVTADIQMMGDRLFPVIWRIEQRDDPRRYTEIQYLELTFKETLPDRLFTVSGLKRRVR